MGFSYSILPFFDACDAVSAIHGPFLSLGSQQLSGNPPAGEKKFAEFSDLLRERYGVREYADIDLNGAASLCGDLSALLPEELYGKWHTFYDGGTLEHVFDIAAAFANIYRLAPSVALLFAYPPYRGLSTGITIFLQNCFMVWPKPTAIA